MKPLSVGALAGLLFASTMVQVSSTALDAIATYDGGACGASNPLGFISTASPYASACNGNLGCNSGTGMVCTTDSGYKAAFAAGTAYGTTPHVIVSKFTGQQCVVGDLQSVSAYAIDKCHMITSGSKYYQVVLSAGGTIATVKFYTGSTCATAHADPDIVATPSVTSGCDTSGATAIRYEFSTVWPAAMKAPTSFDGGDCAKGLGMMSVTADTCTADTTCASGAGAICTTNYNYDSAIATAFGTTPYVTISAYSGAACTYSTLATAKAYTADGKCHKIEAAKYYKVIFSAGVGTATIKFYTEATCTTAHADTAVEVTTSQTTTAGGCDTTGATAIKYAFSTSWPTAKKALTTYDDGDCSKTLGLISVTSTACTADVDCVATTGGEICTSNINYESAIATKFGSTPYVTIARFSGAACTWSTFSTAKAYLADGKCHRIDSTHFYKLSAVPIGGGSEPKILAFTDDACTTADTTAGANIDVTRAKLILVGGSVTGCDTATSNGATLYKVANWPKAMSVAGVGTYTVPASGAACVGGVPSKLTLTDVSGSGTACGATRACSNDKSLADCTTATDYASYLDKAFGSVPYLIKETYTGSNCATRGAITAYAADGTCYLDGADSFKVVASAGSISIKKWAGDVDCGVTVTTHTSTDLGTVTSANILSNACVSNTKYYIGGNWVYASNAAYDDSKCALTPSKLSLTLAPACTAPTGDAACAATTPIAANSKTGYNAPGCAKTTGYFSTIDKAFGVTPYVIQESYTATCALLTGVTAYVADATCHVSGDAASSYKVTYDPATTATAAVKIETFTSQDCTTGAATAVTVAPAAITAKTCSADFTKTYVGGLAAKLTAVTTFSDKDCKLPVQTVFSSSANTCTAVTACTSAGGGLYTKTACTTATVDYTAILATVFGTARRLVTDIYEAKDAKCGVRQGIVAYVGDATCHATLDATTFFKVTLGSSNTATDATFATYSDKDCTKDEKKLTITAANLATATTAPCDTTNFMKFSIGGTEPPTEAPATDAPTPAPTTAVSTGSGKSAAVSSFSVSIFGLLASMLGGLAVLLN